MYFLINSQPVPGSWLDASAEAVFAEAVRQYEATTGREVPVWLAGRFLGWLSSPSRGRRNTGDCRADERLLIGLRISRRTVRTEPPRALLDLEVRVIKLAREHVVERGATVVTGPVHGPPPLH